MLAHEEALTHYSVFPLPIPIHLFIAQDKPINKEGDIESSSPLLNWDKVLPIEKIHVIPVPGDHLSMMDVHVSSLGQAVTQSINQPPPSPLVLTEINYSPLLSIHTESIKKCGAIIQIIPIDDKITGRVAKTHITACSPSKNAACDFHRTTLKPLKGVICYPVMSLTMQFAVTYATYYDSYPCSLSVIANTEQNWGHKGSLRF